MSDEWLVARRFSTVMLNWSAQAPRPSGDDIRTMMSGIPNPTSNADSSTGDTDEDETADPAERFGRQLGVILGIVLVAWAFVGPAHPLALSQLELPVVASFRRPIPTAFFGYVSAITLVFAAVGAIAYPILRLSEAKANGTDCEIADYETAFANGLVKSVLGTTIALTILGFLAPNEYFAIVGEVVLPMFLIFVVALLPITFVPYIGAHLGGFVRDRAGIGPDFLIENTETEIDWVMNLPQSGEMRKSQSRVAALLVWFATRIVPLIVVARSRSDGRVLFSTATLIGYVPGGALSLARIGTLRATTGWISSHTQIGGSD